MYKVLIIQTAFTGDAILASAIIESFNKIKQKTEIQILVRKGNQSLYNTHPHIKKVHVWDKSVKKYQNWRKIQGVLKRETKFDLILNLQRHNSTALLSLLTPAKQRIGYAGSPLSTFYNHRLKHDMKGPHEIERNLTLAKMALPELSYQKPALYPSTEDFEMVAQHGSYYTIAPASVWFTKKWPIEKWIALTKLLVQKHPVHILGGEGDSNLAKRIIDSVGLDGIKNGCGKYSLLQSAALMKGAKMNFTNDSAPLHLASAMNAPVTAIFCSTIPEFGFGPLSDQSRIWESAINLSCRPCGKHGHKACPEGHFKCSLIEIPTDV